MVQWNHERFSFNSPREIKLICISNLRQLFPSPLCVPALLPHWSYPQSWISAVPSPEVSTLPFVLSQSMDRLLCCHTHYWVIYEQQKFTSQRSGGLEVQDQGASRLSIWRGLPSAASGHSTAASSGGERNCGLVRQKYSRGFQSSCKHFYWVIHEGKAFMVQSHLNVLHSNTTFLEVAPKYKFWIDI